MEHSETKTSDHIQIKIKMPNPSQEPPASSKSSNDDLVRGQYNVYLPIREFCKMVNFRDHFEVKFYILTSPPSPCVTKSQLSFFLGILFCEFQKCCLDVSKDFELQTTRTIFLFPVSRLTTQVISFISSLHTP